MADGRAVPLWYRGVRQEDFDSASKTDLHNMCFGCVTRSSFGCGWPTKKGRGDKGQKFNETVTSRIEWKGGSQHRPADAMGDEVVAWRTYTREGGLWRTIALMWLSHPGPKAPQHLPTAPRPPDRVTKMGRRGQIMSPQQAGAMQINHEAQGPGGNFRHNGGRHHGGRAPIPAADPPPSHAGPSQSSGSQ